MSGTRIRCRELLSGDYSSLLVYASLVGVAGGELEDGVSEDADNA